MLSARIQGRDGGIPDDAILPFDLDSDVPNEEQMLVLVTFLVGIHACLIFRDVGGVGVNGDGGGDCYC